MRWIIETSLRLRILIIVLVGVLIAFGSIQLRNMTVDIFPEINPPLVEVQTEALGLSSEEMEALITVPLEADLLNGIAWLDEIYSETVAGMSSILLVFEPGTDPIRARQMVQERLTQTFALPNVSRPPTMLQPLSSSNRVMLVGVAADDMSLIDMSVLAHWVIAPRLTGVPGVANVVVWGQREWQLQVQVDPERLNNSDVSLQQIVTTVGESMWVSPLSFLESSTPGTSGWIDTPNQRLGIQHILPISQAEDLARIPIVGTEGILLGDVTNVVEDHQVLIGDALLNDGPGLILVIEKFPNANILEVTEGVEEALVALQPGLGGIEFDTEIFSSASYINLVIKNLSQIAIASGILILVTLFAFYLGWRRTLISAVTIVTPLIITALILYFQGMTLNIMVLAGMIMALAIIIHNAIVDVDQVVTAGRHFTADTDTDKSIPTIIANAVLANREPLAYTLVLILLSVLPIFFIDGLAGAFFQPFAVAYIITILSSFVVALFVTPALSSPILGNAFADIEELGHIRNLKNIYSNMLSGMANGSNLMMLIASAVVVIALLSIPVMELSLTPELKQTELRIQWESAPSVSRESMLRVTTLVSDELEDIAGVLNVGSHIGRAITGDAVVGINSGEMWVSLDPVANYNDTLASVEAAISGYPGLSFTVENYQPDRLPEIFTEAEHDIVVRLYGHEFDVLQTVAQDMNQAFATVDGVVNVQTDADIVEPQIEIEVDIDIAASYQIKPGDVRRAATTLLSGLTVGNLYEEQKIFEVVVWGVPELRNSINDVENLLIDTPNGQVTLGTLADVRLAPVPVTIRRDAVQRFVDIGITVDGRGIGAVTTDIAEAIKGVAVPFEYHAEIVDQGLQAVNQQSLTMLIIAVVIGCYLLLQSAYNSWRLATIAFLSVFVAISGGLIAAFIGGSVLSIGSLLGLLALLGLSIRIITLSIRMTQTRLETRNEQSAQDVILQVAQSRLMPILITLVTIAVALLPVIFFGNIAGTEILHPMAIVILGGLVTTAILSLFILPPLHIRFNKDEDVSVA